jgi:GrpB-like predicted nucleotidyltransferase (UPF0157 family)
VDRLEDVELRRVDELMPQVEATLEEALARVHGVLPDVETHHVGATAIPGAVTKGDVDIVVRVSATQFPVVVHSLGLLFEQKQVENWTDDFASLGDDDGCELPLGIQVVVRGSEFDVFLYLRDYLRAHVGAHEEYDRIKIEHTRGGADGYWEAKNAFLERVLATRDAGETM